MYDILMVDDDEEVLKINQAFLEKKGFSVTVANSVRQALAHMEKKIFSCIILDVMMPETNGFDFCKTIRGFSDVPIIFLSGKASENDKVNGLLLGADDYIVKPYSLLELATRIEMHIRKHEASKQKAVNSTSVLSFPPLTIHKLSHKVLWNEEEISLSNREFALLEYLATKVGEICTFEDIGNKIYGSYLESDRRTIMVNISRLRKKLENYTGDTQYIESVWSKGYRFVKK